MNQLLWAASLLFLLNFPLHLSGQNVPSGARSAAMGMASVALSDVWSSYNNQAGLAWLKGTQSGAFYENSFITAELNRLGLAVSVPVQKVGTFGFSFTRSGYVQYNENKFGLCYARKFGDVFSLGVQINLNWLHIGDVYGNLLTATGELSFQVKPVKKWVIAAHVYNPTRTPLSEYQREKLPTIFRLGTSYRFHEKLIASIEGEASIEYSPTFRAGVEYRPVKLLYVRAGINTNPVSPSFGFGVYVKKFQMDAAAFWNPLLGFSPQVSMSYGFGK